ncbi:hypothetical protein BH11VER1_BH11VER1_01480 [soil metagenome]
MFLIITSDSHYFAKCGPTPFTFITMKTFLILFAAIMAISVVHAQTQIDEFRDGLQRVPDDFFLVNSSWLDDWKHRHHRLLNIDQTEVVFMMVGHRKGAFETWVIAQRTEDSAKLFGVHLLSDPSGRGSLNETFEIKLSSGVTIASQAWELIKSAQPDAVEINAVLGENSTWYVFARQLDLKGVMHSQLGMAQSLNPPKNGWIMKTCEQLNALVIAKKAQENKK